MSQNLQSVLEAARQLPPELARKQRALSIVEETFGAIKGLDRVALAQLAEDEEFSGY